MIADFGLLIADLITTRNPKSTICNDVIFHVVTEAILFVGLTGRRRRPESTMP